MPPKTRPRKQPARGTARAEAASEFANVPSTKEALQLDGQLPSASPGSSKTAAPEQSTLPNVTQSSELSSAVTAAPGSPPRQPPQRLASLRAQRAAGASVSTEAPSGRAGGLKYQPGSYVRRSKEEREALERAEAERRQSRLAEGGNHVPSSGRGGLQGRGGRGMFRGGIDRFRSGEASGALGGSSVSEGRGRKNPRAGGLLSGLSTSARSAITRAGASGFKRESGGNAEKDKDGDVVMGMATKGSRPAIKKEDQGPTYVSSDEEPDLAEGPRVNIEHINLVSDEESDTEKRGASAHEKGKEPEKEFKIPPWTLKPVRIDRHEHIEKTAGVNTDASSLTSAELRRRAKEKGDAEGSLFLPDDDEPKGSRTGKSHPRAKLKDVEFVRDERRWKGVYQDDDDNGVEPSIKPEPPDHDHMALDNAPQSLATDSEAVAPGADHYEPPSTGALNPLPMKKRSHKSISKLHKPVLQTLEDRQEWARYEEDLRILSEELGPNPKSETPHPSLSAADGGGIIQSNSATDDPAKDKREGLVYLFQLPPLMPKLLPAAEKALLLSLTKADQNHEPHQAPTKIPLKNTLNTEPPPPPKPKSDPDEPFPNQPNTTLLAPHPPPPSGRIGKLCLHSTGRVTATWGWGSGSDTGCKLELGRAGGVAGGMLQEVIMVEHQDELKRGGVDKAERGEGGNGWAIGGLAGGFVVMPDWGTMIG